MSEPSEIESDPTKLSFNSDPGASRSTWIAAAILVLLVAWMGSGFVLPSEQQTAQQDTLQPKTPSVMVRDFGGGAHHPYLQAQRGRPCPTATPASARRHRAMLSSYWCARARWYQPGT